MMSLQQLLVRSPGAANKVLGVLPSLSGKCNLVASNSLGGEMTKKYLSLLFLVASSSFATGVRLPLHSLRDQGKTDHCWAYSMSNFLESRALTRANLDFTIETERDVKYWVDYERMMYIYHTKKDQYLMDYEGGWQIEFWESLLAHGKSILRSANNQAQIIYPLLQDFAAHMPFQAIERPAKDPTLDNWEEVTYKLKYELKTEAEAIAYVTNHLNRRYGVAQIQTIWFDDKIALNSVGEKVLGTDFIKNKNTEAFVLVKPVTDKQYGWIRYIGDRFWGYRYDQAKILELIQTALNRKWPVTFDNVYHAMTIVGYETTDKDTFYAVSDSIPGKITWYDSAKMLSQLNLVSVVAESVAGLLPERGSTIQQLDQEVNYDRLDHVTMPPR